MSTSLRVVVLGFGIAAIALLAGSREAVATPRPIVGACVDADVGSLSIDCEEEDGTDADVGGDVTGQATVCGNAVGILGSGSATCDGTQSAGGSGDGGSSEAWLDADVVDGASAQAIVCGNAVGAGGDAEAGCGGRQRRAATSSDEADIDVLRWGVAVQAIACGNGVAVFGEAEASCQGSQGTAPPGETGDGEGEGAVAGGPASVRFTACGNTVAAMGEAQATCDPEARSPGTGVGGGEGVTTPDPGSEPPEVPPTEVLGIGGVAPGGVAGSGGFLPQTGQGTAALVWAMLILTALGVSVIVAARSNGIPRPPSAT